MGNCCVTPAGAATGRSSGGRRRTRAVVSVDASKKKVTVCMTDGVHGGQGRLIFYRWV
jgi:hypothetical protein